MRMRILTKRVPRLFLLIALTAVLPIGIKLGLAAADIGSTVSGTVTANGSNPAPGIQVSIYNSTSSGSTHTDSSGNYAVGSLLNGNYFANLVATSPTQNSSGLPGSFKLTSQNPYITVNGSNVTQNFSFNTNALTVTVKGGNGNPATGLSVEVTAVSSNNTLTTADGTQTFNVSGVDTQGTTGTDGIVGLNVFPGETYSVCVFTQSHGEFCAPVNVTVNGDTSAEIDLPSFFTVSGTVSGNNTAASGVSVSLFANDGHSGNTHTNSSGSYSIGGLVDDNYFAGLVSSNNAQDSAAAGLPSYFSITSQNPFVSVNGSNVTQNFSFNTNKLNVTVKGGNNNPASGLSVQVTAVGSNTVTTADGTQTFNAGTNVQSLGQTGNDGVVSLNVFSGVTYSVCVFTQSHGEFCAPVNVTVNGDTSAEIDLPSFSTVSGMVTANGGNPVSGVEVSLHTSDNSSNGTAHTDSNGNYSVGSLLNGSHFASLVSTSPTQGSAGLPGSFRLTSQNPYITVNGSDVTQNFSFNSNTLTVSVKDGSNQPLTGLSVEVTAVSSNNTLTTADGTQTFNVSGVDTQGTTGTDGTVGLKVFPGETYSVCVFTQSHGEFCAPVNVTVNGDTNTIVYIGDIPSTPANLAITSPTQNPSLLWTASSGAVSYNIFRNGTKIGSSSNATYTDNIAPEGTDTYYVTAVNFIGESGHSNSVTVYVNHTAPTTTATLSPNPYTDGTYPSPTTVTLSATPATGVSIVNTYYTIDGGSQQTYTSPFNVSGGGSHTITYWSVDNSGVQETANTKTFTITVPPSAPTGLSAMTPTNNAPVLTWNSASSATSYQVWRQDTNTGVNTQVGTSTMTNFTDTYLPGVYNYTVVAVDSIGLTSVPSAPFQVAVTNTTVTSSRNMTAQGQSEVVPVFGTDVLPGLAANNATKATFDFSLGYPGGTFTVTRPLTFTFNAGGHNLFITSTSIDWLVVSGAGSSVGTFQGLASATLDNVTTAGLPFTVTAVDGTRITPASADNFKLTVYTDSSRTSVLYSVNEQLSKGKVKIN